MRAASRVTVLAIVGPTATGKSELAVAVAERLGGEVVNADAMGLYRGMDIGTAKLPASGRRGIAHHQLDVLEVTQEASVAAYQVAARADLSAIRARERLPILAGGSGLYVRAALDRLDIPPTDPDTRQRLEADLAEHGAATLRARLMAVDPVAAQSIEPNNARRIVRALEVVALTGRPFSASMPRREYAEPATLVIGLRLGRDELDRRIESRVARMWVEGLVAEVEGLLAAGLEQSRTARAALGYAQAIDQLRGRLTELEAMDQTASATRRFARRQESWFGPDPRIHWLPADAQDLVERAVALAADPPAVPENG
jgi:tRNA dimethylallyltransferase